MQQTSGGAPAESIPALHSLSQPDIVSIGALISSTRTAVSSEIVAPPNKIDVSDPEQLAQFLGNLQTRLSRPALCHRRPKDINPAKVITYLKSHRDVARSLAMMEETEGVPDIVRVIDGALIFADCSAESPLGRRGMDYYQVVAMAKRFGVHIIPEHLYMKMQNTRELDQKSWSWIRANPASRKSDSALNGIRRGQTVRIYFRNMDYHSKDLGWRAVLRVLKG